jgi:hypothetical protein
MSETMDKNDGANMLHQPMDTSRCLKTDAVTCAPNNSVQPFVTVDEPSPTGISCTLNPSDSARPEKKQRSQAGITIRQPVLGQYCHSYAPLQRNSVSVTDKGKTKIGCHSDNHFPSSATAKRGSVSLGMDSVCGAFSSTSAASSSAMVCAAAFSDG